jgi:hypothetical protein
MITIKIGKIANFLKIFVDNIFQVNFFQFFNFFQLALNTVFL